MSPQRYRKGAVALLTFASLASLMSGCTISSPLKGPGIRGGSVLVETENDLVVVGLTYIKTGKDYQKNKVFWSHVSEVYESMEAQPGLVAYSIRREVFGDQGWTMSIWQDEKSLQDFVQSTVHQNATSAGMPALTQTKFARLTVQKSEIPIPWDQAEEILRASKRQY